jgi:hypothetical protein
MARTNFNAAMQDFIKDKAQKVVVDILTKPRHKTNSYGEPVGESFTLTEFIEKSFQDYMKEGVDYQGRTERGSYSTKHTRAEWIIKEIAMKDLEKVAENEVKKVRQQAKLQVAAAIGKFPSENMVAPVVATALTKGT